MFDKSYYERTKDIKPSKSLSLFFNEHSDLKDKTVIDIGSGALVNSKFLLDKGCNVLSVDKSEHSYLHAQEVKSDRFTFLKKDIFELDFRKYDFDLVLLIFFSPIVTKKEFEGLILNLKMSLKENGKIIVNFLGEEDGWNNALGGKMNFYNIDEVKKLFSDMDISYINEKKEWASFANKRKYWHVIDVACSKRK